MTEDSELLRRYVHDRSEAAFSELVRRRLNLVYSVAVRQCGGDTHLAEDVTQKVFADLARKAGSLMGRPVLSGWLYRSAQFAASDIVRAERRRRAREQETQIMNETVASFDEGTADWDRFRPVLDEAMGDLNDEDRDAVALRFFEERPFADIGRALRLTEDTARKRVERALEKLHAALSRRGVTSTTAALGLALANQAAVAAPAGLAASVTGTALATGAGAAGWGILGAAGAGKLLLGAVGAAAVVAAGTAIYEHRQAAVAEAHYADALRGQTTLLAKLQASESRRVAETKRAQAAEDDSALLLSAIQSQVRATANAGGGGSTVRSIGPAVAEPNQGTGDVTHSSVTARYQHGQDLARAGQAAAALAEYLWCYDEGMVRVSSFRGVRLSFLVGDIARLAKTYPPAGVALRERRDQAERAMMADRNDAGIAMDAASLNSALGEEQRNMVLFEQLPPGDVRRGGLMVRVYPMLVTAQRYTEAVAGRSYAQMNSQFEYARQERPLPPETKNPEELRRVNRTAAITSTSRDIEALAGAGDLVHARSLVERVLAWDSSEVTKTKLQSHLERAGHAELLTAK